VVAMTAEGEVGDTKNRQGGCVLCVVRRERRKECQKSEWWNVG
jgi:hypothetical protein